MKIIAFSDWRTQEIQDGIDLAKREANPPDVIIYAGDDLARFKSAGINYFSQLAKCSKAGVLLAVAGNDDSDEQKNILTDNNVWDLHDRPYVFGDTVFIGVEGSTSGPGVLQHSESALRKHLATLRRRRKAKNIVLVSHPPPYGVLDKGIRFAKLDEHDHHIGSKAVLNFVRTNPLVKLVICGHCHSQGGLSDRYKQALVVNVASDDGRSSEGRMAAIHLDESRYEAVVMWLSTSDLIPPDSLRNLHGVGVRRELALRKAGIDTITALTRCENLFSASEKSELPLGILDTLRLKAESHLTKQVIRIAPFELNLAKAMFLDIETDMSQSRVWLIGVLWEDKFCRFYADTWDEEMVMLTKFLDFLSQNTPSVLISYSCTNFDKRVLESALQRHNLDGYQQFNNIPHVDLGSKLARCFALPIKRRKVKDVGSWFNFQFKQRNLSGIQVANEYDAHIRERRPLNPSAFEYNEDDVRVLAHIVQRLSEFAESPSVGL